MLYPLAKYHAMLDITNHTFKPDLFSILAVSVRMLSLPCRYSQALSRYPGRQVTNRQGEWEVYRLQHLH